MRNSPHATSPRRAEPARLSLTIQQGDEIRQLPVLRAQLRRWVGSALETDARLCLRFVGRDEGLALNRAYRSGNHPTNVLTFVYAQKPTIEADIVICMPVVEDEARHAEIGPIAHLAHLVVHGVLHACGHDHQDDEQAQAMQTRETRILARFGIADPYARAPA